MGWQDIATKEPTKGHRALASLERLGKIGVEFDDQPEFYRGGLDDYLFQPSSRTAVSVITQNVDNLHRQAGTWNAVDLHGRLNQVICMDCGAKIDRSLFQVQLEELNQDWIDRTKSNNRVTIRADGDADGADDYSQVQIPPCPNCKSGMLKPNVVFFGDSVPKHRARRCEAAVDACDGLLVVGSSLAVHSAFRHVRKLSQRGTDVAILNVGETRAEEDGIPVTKIEAPAGATLQGVLEAFSDDL